MARKKEGDGTELLTHLSSIVSELLPLFLEKWADLNDRPRVDELNARIGSLRQGLSGQNRRIRNLTILCLVLIVWNIFLSVLLFIDWQV